jgi:SAM-dependent methyltransferase
VKWRQTFLVHDGWTLPPYLDRCLCSDCGTTYADNADITEEDYNTYYKEKYGWWGPGYQAGGRHEEDAVWADKTFPDKSILVVDFGGGEGEQLEHLKAHGFVNARIVDLGDEMTRNVDLMFAEQVLEHLYDLRKSMLLISNAVKPGGYLVVEGPEMTGNIEGNPLPIIDWQQKHINHFTILDYLRLMRAYGFELIDFKHDPYYNIPNVRLVFRKEPADWACDSYVRHVNTNVDEIVRKLEAIGDRKVIVWGCGDVCLHSLSRHMLNVAYFVDKDPAMVGTMIAGHPVYGSVLRGDKRPIVMIVQGQKQDILNDIKAEGLTNEVIVVC